MKTRLISSCKVTIVLAGLAMLVGILKGSESAPSADTAAVPSTTSAPVANIAVPPTAPLPASAPFMPEVKLSPGAADVARLAQSGLGDQVMLAYVGNANTRFNLGSDQIVYLNDLGVSGDVVKAMIQHDASQDAAAQAAAASLAAASAPSIPFPTNYVDPNSTAAFPPPPPPDDSTGPMPPMDSADYVPPDDADYFYSSLAPYGSWNYVAGLGLCWRPTVGLNNAGWQPYGDRGRWLYTDCGWYWQSDYSWGWAAFHYGRWFRDGAGAWAWAPDRVWGPAWVSWRHSQEYCGWAALPPSARFVPGSGFQVNQRAVGANFEFGLQPASYTFIPLARMSDYAPTRYEVPPSQAGEVYRETALINHFAVQNNRVVNPGVDPNEVSALAHTEIRRAVIRDLPGNIGQTPQADRLAKTGNQLVMYRPQLPTPTAAHAGSAVLPASSGYYPAGNANGVGQSESLAYTPRATAPLYYSAHSPPSAASENYPAGSLVVIGNRNGNTAAASYSRFANRTPVYQNGQSGRTYQVFGTGRADAQGESAENKPYIMGAGNTVAQRWNGYSANARANEPVAERSEAAPENSNHESHSEYHASAAPAASHAAASSAGSSSGKK